MREPVECEAYLKPTGQLVSTLRRVAEHLRGAIYDPHLSYDVSRPFPQTLGALVDAHLEMADACEIGLDAS